MTLNYQHIYHAGNHADVFKHVTLLALLAALQQKTKPIFYLDTHAGNGMYDLTSTCAAKTKESLSGIHKLQTMMNAPHLIQHYLAIIKACNNHEPSWRFYPGSVYFARSQLRPGDRIIACELALNAYQALRKLFIGVSQIAIHQQDGLLGLKAFLPPSERRGLILIDPPFENATEFKLLVKALRMALMRFATGVYAVWYPIVHREAVKRFQRELRQLSDKITFIHFTIYPTTENRFIGSGMAIFNPPYQLKHHLQAPLHWLWDKLSPKGHGDVTMSDLSA